jgi:hypothetical protein
MGKIDIDKYFLPFEAFIKKLKRIDKIEIPKDYQLVETDKYAREDSKESKKHSNSKRK